MKVLGVILIVAGILMFVFGSISLTQKEKVIDLGSVEVNKQEKKKIEWPGYAGGVAIAAGIIVLVASRKRLSAAD